MLLQQNDIFANHYRLTELIGEGGFAYVWLAEDMRIEELCAIKIYKEHILTDGIMDEHRFRTIMRQLYNIDNPNILTPKDFGNDRGMLYYVMRYLRGGSISQYAGSLDEQQIWEILKQTSSGLENLHSKRLIHRDIKPENIMIDSDSSAGTVYKITDFDTVASMDFTKTRMNAGSQSYQAPECFDGSIVATDETKLDIWALGASVYELVTGVTPFNNYGGLSQGAGYQIPDIQQNISRNLKNLIYSCLDPDSNNRPSAMEIYNICNSNVARTTTVRNTNPEINKGHTNLNKVPNLVKVEPPPSPHSPNFFKPVFITLCIVAVAIVAILLLRRCQSQGLDRDLPLPKYHLTVINGSGSGDYKEDTLVTIKANEPKSGEEFVCWTGNTASIANVNAENTTFKMGNSEARIEATYKPKPKQDTLLTYLLTVNYGTGSGKYAAETEVSISANAAPSGQVFYRWIGNTNGIANVNSATTTYTMGNADATVTATYTTAQTTTCTISASAGSGGSISPSGSVTVVSGNNLSFTASPNSGKEVDVWTLDGSIVQTGSNSYTVSRVTSNHSLSVSFKNTEPITYTLTVNNGTGSGSYTTGTVVNISANAAPSGQVFDKWTGSTGRITAVNSANTTFTMGNSDAIIQATYKQNQTTQTQQLEPDPCYYNDKGKIADAQRNYEEAFKNFYEGAQKGCNLAMYNLGRYYAIGPGRIKRDSAEARRWLNKALANGVPEAQNIINRYRLNN
jgi:serine/threonine protein kinase